VLPLQHTLVQHLLILPVLLLLVKRVWCCRDTQPLEVASVGLLGCGD
tara:strand:+ start:793 stop:933 length:141 start_codon:yes stop_codon:yes gene_type:complete